MEKCRNPIVVCAHVIPQWFRAGHCSPRKPCSSVRYYTLGEFTQGGEDRVLNWPSTTVISSGTASDTLTLTTVVLRFDPRVSTSVKGDADVSTGMGQQVRW